MNTATPHGLADFERDERVAVCWDAGRRLMATKQLVSVVERPEFLEGFERLGWVADTGEGLDRLLAIDMVVRLSSFAKGLKPRAEAMLAAAMKRELPQLSLVADTKSLPAEAKPAEVRENVALALTHASGPWVIGFVLRALAEEDKSQRCRLELARQLAAREPDTDRWIGPLVEQEWSRLLLKGNVADQRAGRLRDIAAALADVIRERRTQLRASEKVGRDIAALCRVLASLSPRDPLPSKLPAAAAEVARLVDELLAIRLDLIVEPDAYAPVEVFQRWWQPLPYPDTLAAACQPVCEKLVSAIRLRAKMGQRSDRLSSRLVQSLGSHPVGMAKLRAIAEQEEGLSPDVEDWLLGRVRETSATTAAMTELLGVVSIDSILTALAPLVSDAVEALSTGPDASRDQLVAELRRVANRITLIAAKLQIEVVGQRGDVVEYADVAHETSDGTLPREPHVRVIRPMVVRRRQDCGVDILRKALVTEA